MATIQQIAEAAGVSPATVSRVFSNHPNVKPHVKERVFAVARQHGYTPRLSTRRRNVVVITPSWVEHPVQSYVAMVISHLARELSQRGYRIEILPADSLDRLDNIQFCGAIQLGSQEVPRLNWYARFEAPLIAIDREIADPQPGVFSVRSNEKQGMELAIDYLHQRGHRRIACLVSQSTVGNPPLRVQFLEEALARRGLHAGTSLVRLVTEETFVEEVGRLLRNKVDAVFSPGGSGGIIAAYALSLYRLRIPEDISLMVSERAMVSRYCVPPQTAITQDYNKLASLAVDAIDAHLRRRAFPSDTVLDYRLLERDSVADRVAPRVERETGT